MKWLKFAARNTLRNRRRSLVTIAVAALGTAGVLLASGFAVRAYQALEQAAASDTGHLTLARSGYFDREEATPLQYGIEDYQALTERLRADPDVRVVMPRVRFSGLVSNGDKSVIMLGTGIDPAAEFRVRGNFVQLHAGTLLGSKQDATAEVMLGRALAQSLSAQVGSELTLLASTRAGALNALDVRVSGIFTTGILELDQRTLYTDIRTAQLLIDAPRVSSLGIYLRGMDVTDSARARIAARLQAGFVLKTWREQATFYEAVRNLYNRIFGAMGSILLVIVLFVVSSAMASAILERMRELGTLRALGTLPSQLIRIVALEGATLGAAGALLGAALALTVSVGLLYARIQMPPPPGRSAGYPLQIAIVPILYGYAVLAVTLLSTACAAVIGRRTTQKTIVEALNHA